MQMTKKESIKIKTAKSSKERISKNHSTRKLYRCAICGQRKPKNEFYLNSKKGYINTKGEEVIYVTRRCKSCLKIRRANLQRRACMPQVKHVYNICHGHKAPLHESTAHLFRNIFILRKIIRLMKKIEFTGTRVESSVKENIEILNAEVTRELDADESVKHVNRQVISALDGLLNGTINIHQATAAAKLAATALVGLNMELKNQLNESININQLPEAEVSNADV